MMCFDWTIFRSQVGSLKVTKVKYWKLAIDPFIFLTFFTFSFYVEPFLNYNTMYYTSDPRQ